MNHLITRFSNNMNTIIYNNKGKQKMVEKTDLKLYKNHPMNINISKKFNYYWFSVLLTEQYYNRLHRSDESFYTKIKEMMKEFSRLDHIEQCNVFLSTDLNRRPKDGIKQ